MDAFYDNIGKSLTQRELKSNLIGLCRCTLKFVIWRKGPWFIPNHLGKKQQKQHNVPTNNA